MARVDFYLMNSDSERDCDILACRLTEKAYKQGYKIQVKTRDAQQSKRIDDLLWTFSQGSFVPHTVDPSQSETPVFISHEDGIRDSAILINLTDKLPQTSPDNERVMEIVSNLPERRATARTRYRDYREMGHDLHTHQV
ncbi:MAG: DNA polymerase III subunit chi [Gammaproteobacteria bacterium]|nr:DNA polymerase III subunit chi [Gammaproteobacteria bacterium]